MNTSFLALIKYPQCNVRHALSYLFRHILSGVGFESNEEHRTRAQIDMIINSLDGQFKVSVHILFFVNRDTLHSSVRVLYYVDYANDIFIAKELFFRWPPQRMGWAVRSDTW